MAHWNSRDPRDRADIPRLCDHPDCLEEGLHPAPQSRTRLRDYFWFCKEHARDYNASWNYCVGLGPAEIDAIIRADMVWDRPTWPLGLQQRATYGSQGFKTRDNTGFFDPDGGAPKPAAPEGSDAWAAQILSLKPPLTLTAVKRRYKELAKRFHPDVNGGDPQAEERLKQINQAYSTLRAALGSKA